MNGDRPGGAFPDSGRPAAARPDTPVVFIHAGASDYLPYTLAQAGSFAAAEVVLLGSPARHAGVTVRPLAALGSAAADEFRAGYRHLSSTPREFELFCWLRWFHLLQFMRTHGHRTAWHFDSDVLLYSSVAELERLYITPGTQAALVVPRQDPGSYTWAASAHASYWTLEALEAFCDFALRSFQPGPGLQLYEEKYNWHLSQHRLGGICDMTTLYLFYREHEASIRNLAVNQDGNCFDHSINGAGNYLEREYVMRGAMKRVEFVDGRPHFRCAGPGGGLVRVHGLHFQDAAKQQLWRFYTGARFEGKTLGDLRFAAAGLRRSAAAALNSLRYRVRGRILRH